MRVRDRRNGEVFEASMRWADMGADDGDCWVWVLEAVPAPGSHRRFPIKPPADHLELVDATAEERERLKAGGYTGALR